MRAGKTAWKKFLAHLEKHGTYNASSLAAALSVSRQYLVNSLVRGASMAHLRAREINKLVGWPVGSWPRVTTKLTYPKGPRPVLNAKPEPEVPVVRKPRERRVVH